MDSDARPFFRQAQRDPASDAPGGPGDEHDFSVHMHTLDTETLNHREKQIGVPPCLRASVSKLSARLCMHLHFLRLHALLLRFGQPPREMRPAPEYRGRGA